MEGREALFKNVHFREEKLGILLHVQLAIELPQRFPESWATLLTELAMEHKDGLLTHELLDLLDVMQESAL